MSIQQQMNKPFLKNLFILICASICIVLLLANAKIAEAVDMNSKINTASIMQNNPDMACSAVCTRTGPLRSDDPIAASLPFLVKSTLTPPASQDFGVLSPMGSSPSSPTGVITGVVKDPSGNMDSVMSVNFTSSVVQQAPFQRQNNSVTTFTQSVANGSPSLQDQNTDIFFNVDSLTDSNGELIGSATGSFAISIKEGFVPVFTSSGTFTWNAVSGWLLN